MKRLLKSSNVAEIAWCHMDHTREDGTPAHETLGSKSISCRSLQTPCIFKYLKEWVEERLDMGVNTRQIYEDHKKMRFNA